MHDFIIILFLLFCFTQNSQAQVRPSKSLPKQKASTEATQDTTKNQVIIVEYSDYAEGTREEDEEIRKLAGNVELRQDSVYMSCDTATIQVIANTLSAEGDVVIQQNDTLVIFSDSLAYLGDSRVADLYYNVVLQNGTQQLFTDRLNYNLETKLAQYFAGAILTDGKTQLQSKRGYYYVDNNDAFFKDSVFVVDPEFELRADTLQFNTKTKVVTFLGPTRINIGESKIYCEAGYYDTEKNYAEFRVNPQYVKGDQEATADVIRYDGSKKEVMLDGNARFIENDRKAIADRIRYDEANDITYLEGNALYEDDKQRIVSDRIVYDAKNGKYTTAGRSVVNDGPQILEANSIGFDDATGLGVATGNVIWRDTSTDLTIQSEELKYDKESDYLIASGGTPLMTSLIEGDTMFLVADTLKAVRADKMKVAKPDTTTFITKDSLTITPKDAVAVSPTDSLAVQDTLANPIVDTLQIEPSPPAEPDTSRNLIAYGDVRIFKSDLQAVCDSLVFEGRDSIFNFYQNPLVWSDTTQFSADTILMKMNKGQLDTILLRNNGFVVNSPDEILFNQIKGRAIAAYFEESELYKILVEGNAEFVYYLLDDAKAYIGVNKAICSNMVLDFKSNQVERINCFPGPKAKLMPVQNANQSELKLDGYGWYINRRPMSKADLYKNRGQETVVLDSVRMDSLQVQPILENKKTKSETPKDAPKRRDKKGKAVILGDKKG